MLGVPLLRDGVPIGVLSLTHAVVKPFTDRQIELVATFADQAVIAIENVRLFDEVQARTRELDRVAGAADGDLRGAAGHLAARRLTSEPVFETMLANAVRFCEASSAFVIRSDGELCDPMPPVRHGLTRPNGLEIFQRTLPAAAEAEDTAASRATSHRRRCPDPPTCRQSPAIAGLRSLAQAAPIRTYRRRADAQGRRADRCVSSSTARRCAACSPTSRSSWCTNFAAQAVIAIENTRLLNELRRAPRSLRIAAAADRHRRRAQGHQPLDLRSASRCCRRWSNWRPGCATPTRRTITRQKDGVFYRAESYGFSPEFIELVRNDARSSRSAARSPDGPCSKARSFIFPMCWPIRNTR